ncbi:MAG: tRNA pseudouridine(38-40) synthase TruA [Luteolibacter sp.]
MQELPQAPSFSAVPLLKFKLVIAFDGTAYHGWQSQHSGRGVQNMMENALSRLFPSRPQIVSSSRTDAGVHALGMVAHFEIPADEFKMPDRHLTLAINACLPDDIRIQSAGRAAENFHARFDATGKQYRYHVWNDAAMNPLLRATAWHVPQALDLAAMRRAAPHFTGTHDFSAFTANRGDVLENPVRTLTRCEIRRSGKRLTFIIEGEGFLYKMCRGIVGTLVQIGSGKFTADAVPELLAGKDRTLSGMNAPAHGLVLQKVFYP